MKGLPFVLVFTAMTFLAWGAYGPVLHHGAMALEHDSMRAFVGVGLAYFLIAVIIPFAILRGGNEPGKWTISGAIYSLVAGGVGAVGALGIILALGYGGRTVYVMPLVFGFAPVVNTLVTAFLGRSFKQIRPIFIGGIIATALGAGGVLFFKPAPPANGPGAQVLGVAVSIVIAALCWGSYGPMLHIGQGKMGGSRLRPFACVGLAYFAIAVAAPLFVIYSRAEDAGAWTPGGMTWSFLAGVAGAIGALGVILAFNAGGKPYYVMPLIFGFAPVVNTFISLTEGGKWSEVQPMFWVSLAVVIAGAVTVLINAPKPGKAHAPATPPTPSAASTPSSASTPGTGPAADAPLGS